MSITCRNKTYAVPEQMDTERRSGYPFARANDKYSYWHTVVSLRSMQFTPEWRQLRKRVNAMRRGTRKKAEQNERHGSRKDARKSSLILHLEGSPSKLHVYIFLRIVSGSSLAVAWEIGGKMVRRSRRWDFEAKLPILGLKKKKHPHFSVVSNWTRKFCLRIIFFEINVRLIGSSFKNTSINWKI